MSAVKISALVLYVVLAAVAITQGGTTAGIWALRILVILAILHTLEMVVFFKACQRAGGSLPLHLLNVFLFGVLHMREIKAAPGGS